MSTHIPTTHIYENKKSAESGCLSQGDIIFLDKELKQEVLKHFNFDFQLDYLMIVSQTCDLVRRSSSTSKIKHVALSLIRPFNSYIKHAILDFKCQEIGDNKLIKDDDYHNLKTRIFDLINNANAKTHLFLPKKAPFQEHMVAVFNTLYPLRFEEKYELLLKNKVLSVRNDYKAKIGNILSTLFNRVIVTELIDQKNWDQKKVITTIERMLDDYGIIYSKSKVIEKYKSNPANNTISNSIIKEKLRDLTLSMREEETRKDLKKTLSNLEPDILGLIRSCMRDEELKNLDEKQLNKKLKILLDQKIYS